MNATSVHTCTMGYLTALCSLALGVLAIIRDAKSLPQRAFAAGMTVLAFESVFLGLSLSADSAAEIWLWQTARLVSLAFIPGPWLLFSLTYSRGNYREFLLKWRPVIVATFGLPIVCAALFYSRLIDRLIFDEAHLHWIVRLNPPGLFFEVLALIGSVLILMNLERTFRASVGTMRWRIKFMLLGVGLIFGVRIYTSSQALLYSSVHLAWEGIHFAGLGLGCGLMAWSWARSRHHRVEVYPSQEILSNSLTVVLAGIYLMIIGVIARVVTALGGDRAFPLKAFLVLLSLAGLFVMLMSDRLRQGIALFVSRHFKRPIYNYRQVWMQFSERISPLLSEADLCRTAAHFVSDTLQLLSVTIWLVDRERGLLTLGGSTSLDEGKTDRSLALPPEGLDSIEKLGADPIDIERSKESWLVRLREVNPDFFKEGGRRWCVLLVSGTETLGFMIVGDRVQGILCSTEDLELLKCIGQQIAAHLRCIQLSKRLMRVKEMEAFQTVSTFFVHDLKNTASTLSLMLQNLRSHFEDPAFREDAIRAVTKGVTHLHELISRLSLLRGKLELKPGETDLNELVARTTSALNGALQATLVEDLHPLPLVVLDPAQMEKVLTNLLLNAKDAVGKNGRIRVETRQVDDWVQLSVSDNGCGMTPEFVREGLFRPFRTTKKNGIGIGMYHSRIIVEAHRGTIDVESEPGKGTTFRIWLPARRKSECGREAEPEHSRR